MKQQYYELRKAVSTLRADVIKEGGNINLQHPRLPSWILEKVPVSRRGNHPGSFSSEAGTKEERATGRK